MAQDIRTFSTLPGRPGTWNTLSRCFFSIIRRCSHSAMLDRRFSIHIAVLHSAKIEHKAIFYYQLTQFCNPTAARISNSRWELFIGVHGRQSWKQREVTKWADKVEDGAWNKATENWETKCKTQSETKWTTKWGTSWETKFETKWGQIGRQSGGQGVKQRADKAGNKKRETQLETKRVTKVRYTIWNKVGGTMGD